MIKKQPAGLCTHFWYENAHLDDVQNLLGHNVVNFESK